MHLKVPSFIGKLITTELFVQMGFFMTGIVLFRRNCKQNGLYGSNKAKKFIFRSRAGQRVTFA